MRALFAARQPVPRVLAASASARDAGDATTPRTDPDELQLFGPCAQEAKWEANKGLHFSNPLLKLCLILFFAVLDNPNADL